MRIIIIEDDLYWQKRIHNIVRDYFSDSADIIETVDLIPDSINITDYNLFILDIEVKDKNGIEFGLRIKEENTKASIIYVSAYYSYLTQGYKTRAIGFVLKDDLRFDELLIETIDDFYREKRSSLASIKLKSGIQEYTVLLKDIIYIESYGRQLVYHTSDNSIKVYEKISDAENKLKDSDFLRIHKSYLVNMAHIKFIRNYATMLNNGQILPCSELKYKEIVSRFTIYKGKF